MLSLWAGTEPTWRREKMVPRLFTATSYMKVAGREDRTLTVGWHIRRRTSRRDTSDLVSVPDCDTECVVNELEMRLDYADECFDADEVELLRKFLGQALPQLNSLEVGVVDIPITETIMAYKAIPAGGGDEFIKLDKLPAYDLPFTVWGHYYMWENDDSDEPSFPGFQEGNLP